MNEQPPPSDRAPEHRQRLVARLDRLASRWLPADFDGRPLEEQRRLRTMLGMCAFGAPAAGLLSVYALATTGLEASLVIAGLTCMLASVPLLIRWTGSAALPAHMGLCAFCLCIGIAMWLDGGVNAHGAGYFVLTPLAAMLLAGDRAGWFWGAASVSALLLMHWADGAGLSPVLELPEDERQLMRIVDYCIPVMLGAALARVFSRINDQLFEKLQGQKAESDRQRQAAEQARADSERQRREATQSEARALQEKVLAKSAQAESDREPRGCP